jgi:hypothetical protein
MVSRICHNVSLSGPADFPSAHRLSLSKLWRAKGLCDFGRKCHSHYVTSRFGRTLAGTPLGAAAQRDGQTRRVGCVPTSASHAAGYTAVVIVEHRHGAIRVPETGRCRLDF